MTAPKTEDLCSTCGHKFDPHILVGTTGDPQDGGIIVCNLDGCQCYSTWGLEGKKPVRIPDRFELERIREQVRA